MQNLLKKLGFSYRGIVYVKEDDDPHLAYEKNRSDAYDASKGDC